MKGGERYQTDVRGNSFRGQARDGFPLFVPESIRGRIIGRGGSGIKEFNDRHDCEAYIDKKDGCMKIRNRGASYDADKTYEDAQRMILKFGNTDAETPSVRETLLDSQSVFGEVEWKPFLGGFQCRLQRRNDPCEPALLEPALKYLGRLEGENQEMQIRFGVLKCTAKSTGIHSMHVLSNHLEKLSATFCPQLPLLWDAKEVMERIVQNARFLDEIRTLSVELNYDKKKVKVVFPFKDDLDCLDVARVTFKNISPLILDLLCGGGMDIRLAVASKEDCKDATILNHARDFAVRSYVRNGHFCPMTDGFVVDCIRIKTRRRFRLGDGLFLDWSQVRQRSDAELVDETEVELSGPLLDSQVGRPDKRFLRNYFKTASVIADRLAQQCEADQKIVCTACLRSILRCVYERCSGPQRHALCRECIQLSAESHVRGVGVMRSDGALHTRCCEGVFPMAVIVDHLKKPTLIAWSNKRDAQVESDARTRVRMEQVQVDAYVEKNTKKCPSCALPWADPIHCSHVTCNRAQGGCGFEFCWECLCDYDRVRKTDNSAHHQSCKFHSDNL